ncbi:MAG: PRC-barrel domain-containing protein [Ignavibacteriales bacterium]
MQEKARIYGIYKASTLTGNRVKNAAGERVGRIKEIMIDLEEGRIAYAVLSFGDFFGLGGKLFAIPWNALVFKPHESVFILNVDKERLKNSPGFNKNHWPDAADPQWSTGPVPDTDSILG